MVEKAVLPSAFSLFFFTMKNMKSMKF